LSKPSFLGFEFVLHAERHESEWVRRQAFSVASLTPHMKDADARLSAADLQRARSLGDTLKSLPRDTVIFAAARALLKALPDTWWETRYLMLWVALEALFGPSNPSEITYRLSQRLAFFLASNRSEAGRLFGSAKEGYGLRSKIVHGLRLQRLGKEKSAEMMHQVECALVKILSTPQSLEVFKSERRREDFLDRLAFSQTGE
jgi:Apea-like HEPN